MSLERSVAEIITCDADFAAFRCCEDGSSPWEQEAENYVRAAALRRASHCLAFRHEGELVAVSAFDQSVLAFPFSEPVDHPTWHMSVLAISLAHQRGGLSAEVFRATFAAMKELDSTRESVTASVHKEHEISLAACASVGLDKLMLQQPDGDYWLLFGSVEG